MRILRIIDTLDPTHGGPIDSLINGTYTMEAIGHTTEIITLDDPTRFVPNGFPGVIHDLSPSLGKYRFNLRLVPWLVNHGAEYDAVIVEGVWQYPTFAVWLASRVNKFPYFMIVHGALDPWFNTAYPLKKIKKMLYWPWGVYPSFRDAKGVIFSNQEEKILASQSFKPFRANDFYVNYGIKAPPENIETQKQAFFSSFPDLKNKRILLYLSRIDPKKGCDILIDAFAKLAQQYQDVHLVMAGPDKIGLVPALKQQAARLGISEKITWAGMLQGDIKWGAFRAADVFVLSTHSENFGIAIVEALACKVPVLITNKVNIWREIEEDGAAFVADDQTDSFYEAMEKWFALSKAEQVKMRSNAINCFMDRYEITKAVKQFIEIIS